MKKKRWWLAAAAALGILAVLLGNMEEDSVRGDRTGSSPDHGGRGNAEIGGGIYGTSEDSIDL